MARATHPDNDLEKVLKSLEVQGWWVERGKKYYKAKCPCDEKHMKTIHITPNKGYRLDLIRELARRTCWQEDL